MFSVYLVTPRLSLRSLQHGMRSNKDLYDRALTSQIQALVLDLIARREKNQIDHLRFKKQISKDSKEKSES